MEADFPAPLLELARDRYISYALSVITARALPDVRDGLKPVQRRILYTMYHNLHLTPDARYRKSASVVGDTMSNYHPHGDSAIYEAMVRMAQDFSLLHPLVDGQGNFGSLDGDNAAAYRYTEARLRPIAMELLSELGARTVDYRPTYDSRNNEPIVLPAQFPHILVNGSEGIAVGMATRIPPHNLREVIDAAILLIDRPNASVADLCKKVLAPDFPTGGEITSTPGELLALYEEGQGAVRVRTTWTTEQKGKKHQLILTCVPYGVVKGPLVEKLGEIIAAKKLPQVLDVRDESTNDVRIVLELRGAGDAEAAMAWLFKHTPLQTQFSANLTCLVPTERPEIGQPQRLDLKSLLRHWLDFRKDTVRRRLENELRLLRERLHLLDALAKIFPILDEVIKIIRASEGKRDAAEKLMSRFKLDDIQVEYILELKLWRLAKLEIQLILEERAEKQTEAKKLEGILQSESEVWAVVRKELLEVRKQHGVARKTSIRNNAPEPTYEESAYVVAEDTIVIVTRDGWIKRQSTFSTIEKVRVREGDAVGWMFKTSTRATVAFLSSVGTAYVLRADDIPATTGHGEPIQRSFNFADGERLVGVVSLDPRNLPDSVEDGGDDAAGPFLVAVSANGRVVRMPVLLHTELSNKNGRRLMRVEEAGDGVIAAYVAGGEEYACVASKTGNVLCFRLSEVPLVKAAGKGVTAMDLDEEGKIHAFVLAGESAGGIALSGPQGKIHGITPAQHHGTRGGKGKCLFKKGVFGPWTRPPEILLERSEEEA